MPTIGGSVFIRNAIKYDYCVREAINSISFCDQVVVLDCSSDDGTTEMLRDFCAYRKNVQFYSGEAWDVGTNYDRLMILANVAVRKLRTDWHFMIQGDEVLHESSIPWIADAVSKAGSEVDSFFVRRFNLFGDLDHCVRLDLETQKKPCSDCVIRLARRGVEAFGDAESLAGRSIDRRYENQIVLFHYGYVRKDSELIEKTIDMQSWFHGRGSEPDQRVVAMRPGGKYISENLMPSEWMMRTPLNHPVAAREWVRERRK